MHFGTVGCGGVVDLTWCWGVLESYIEEMGDFLLHVWSVLYLLDLAKRFLILCLPYAVACSILQSSEHFREPPTPDADA